MKINVGNDNITYADMYNSNLFKTWKELMVGPKEVVAVIKSTFSVMVRCGNNKKANHFGLAFFINQRGRLQPSTFGVYELNYCVRDGNRWILIAIATESVRVCTLKTT